MSECVCAYVVFAVHGSYCDRM